MPSGSGGNLGANQRRRIWIILGLALPVLLCGLLWRPQSNEPRYQGKTVTEWISDVAAQSATSSTYQRSAKRWARMRMGGFEFEKDPDIRAMLTELGSNAVPALLKQLREGESARVRLFAAIATSTKLPKSWSAAAANNLWAPQWRVDQAATALRLLGTNAACAIPELERLAGSSQLHWGNHHAMNLLAGMGADGWKTLGSAITNATPATRSALQLTLQGACSYALMGGNLRQREEAAIALCLLDSPPYLVIPVLADMINSNDAAKQERALGGLAKLAPDYVAARDAVRQAAKSDHPEIRSLAQSILGSTNQINTTAKH